MTQHTSSPQDVPLAPLWADVVEAREEVAVMRGARMAAHPSASVARSKLLGALELYAVALAASGRCPTSSAMSSSCAALSKQRGSCAAESRPVNPGNDRTRRSDDLRVRACSGVRGGT